MEKFEKKDEPRNGQPVGWAAFGGDAATFEAGNDRPIGWTTYEESAMLFDAGLDPMTADMCYSTQKNQANPKTLRFSSPMPVPWSSFPEGSGVVPCWSLGALMRQIMVGCGRNLIENAVKTVFNGVSGNMAVKTDVLRHKPSKGEMSVRAMNILRNAIGFSFTVGDMTKLERRKILHMRNCGEKTIKEIDDYLSGYGLSMW